MDITKKPYEISLWKEELIWHRRKLVKLDKTKINENNYKRGTYYVEQADALGEPTYELSYKSFEEGVDYYEFASLEDENYLEGTLEDVTVDEAKREEWNCPQVLLSYYNEKRICTIGSHTMDFPGRAVNAKLTSKINGENTLVFTLYYRFFDIETGEEQYNPFVNQIANERKVKLSIGEGDEKKWYHLVVKQIQENSETKAFTYTCKDQFVNELSKSGFEIELDNELENNMGTITKLASTILEGSDWRVKETDKLYQYVEEPLYEIVLNGTITAASLDEFDEEGNLTENTITLNKGEKIYAFYSHIANQEKQLQFLIPNNSNFTVNDSYVIDKDSHPNYKTEVTFYESSGNGKIFLPNFASTTATGSLVSKYRGKRLVRQVQTKYDSTIDKFVTVYENKKGGLRYGFTESEYVTSNTVKNLTANPNGFSSISGWVEKNSVLTTVTYPAISIDTLTGTRPFGTFLKVSSNENVSLLNTGLSGFRKQLDGFVVGQTKMVVRLKYKDNNNISSDNYSTDGLSMGIYKFSYDGSSFKTPEDPIFKFNPMETKPTPNDTENPSGYYEAVLFPDKNNWGNYYFINNKGEYEKLANEHEFVDSQGYYTQGDNYLYYEATCGSNVSKAELLDYNNRYGLVLNFNKSEVYIEDVQLFFYQINDNKLCVPGGKIEAEVKTVYKYYIPNDTMKSIDDLNPEYVGYSPSNDYIVQYNENGENVDKFTKVMSITAKESNRFNLIQDLNEKFECWSVFTIEEHEDGRIKLGKDKGLTDAAEAYRQQKFVSFYETAGQDKPIGFKYGINLKSIQRSIDSTAIVTKMIVKDNANEFAPNGFCSIARATENPIGENFLMNFEYYARQKLLDLDLVTCDLYVENSGYLGYYTKLKSINANREATINLQSSLITEIANLSASVQTYKTACDAASEEIQTQERNIVLLITPPDDKVTSSFNEAVTKYGAGWEKDSKYISYTTKLAQSKNILIKQTPLYNNAKNQLTELETLYNDNESFLKDIAEQKRALNLQFYKKYSRFIQEGSWIDENYVDDNLYYLDSVSTLHTSSQPKVSYTINVIDLSQLINENDEREYQDYDFKLGDKTYIEDPEFFGWSLVESVNPYREEVVVSEVVMELDSPEKNQIKVQNYKTQFEDLFQRIAAQTQQAEYHTGEYNRASKIVEPNGTISAPSLAESFANNSYILQNAKDQSVVISESGITTTNLSNPSEMVRIVSGGIILSNDGGASWKTGITGSGINTSYLTSGVINVDNVFIKQGDSTLFGWDKDGITAYRRDENYVANPGKFVRFDQFGIYGVTSEEKFVPKVISDIKSNANFGLTWDGFFIKSQHTDATIGISSDDDFYLETGGKKRIKIGSLGNEQYGIRFWDENDNIVMETKTDGTLWLKDVLHIGDNNDRDLKVYIGNIKNSDKKDENGNTINCVIQAGRGNTHFNVYEDGTLEATGATIKGTIYADEGTIGGLEVDYIKDFGYEVIITCDKGVALKNGENVVLTAQLYYNGKLYEPTDPGKVLYYNWFDENGTEITTGVEGNQLTINDVEFNSTQGYLKYNCKISIGEQKEEANE